MAGLHAGNNNICAKTDWVVHPIDTAPMDDIGEEDVAFQWATYIQYNECSLVSLASIFSRQVYW